MESYFLTYGRGMKNFVIEELDKLRNNHDSINNYKLIVIEQEIEGKILFDTNLELESLLGLKTVERLFILLFYENLLKLDSNESDREHILNLIQRVDFIDLNKLARFVKIVYNKNESFDNEIPAKRACCTYEFRVDCRLTGKWKQQHEFRLELAQKISDIVLNRSEFENHTSDRDPDFILNCHLTDLCFILGLPLAKNSLSLRNYIKNVGLRSTVCAVMIQIAFKNIENYKIILDPFCGKGTIQNEFLETIKNKKNSCPFFLCSDMNFNQMDKAKENLYLYESESRFDFLLASVYENLELPYRNEFVDLIITDLPFGKNHKIENFNSQYCFYKKTLLEFNRLLTRPIGAAIILLNYNESKSFEKELNELRTQKLIDLQILSKYSLSLGETSGQIYELTVDKVK